MIWANVFFSVTFSPSISKIKSPALNPARSAGELGKTAG